MRWVASKQRGLWIQYAALHHHFNRASADSARDTKEKSMYRGLKTRLTLTEFVMNMSIMYDALTELAEVSLEL